MTDDAVDLSYETPNGERRALPIRLGFLGDLAGDAALPEPGERRFVPVTGPDLASTFAEIRPELHLTVEDDRGELVPVRLAFSGLDDFAPSAIASRFGGGGRTALPGPDTDGSLLDRILEGEERSTSSSRQADQVLRDDRLQGLFAAWLGLAHLASRCVGRVTLVALSANEAELVRDLEDAPDLEHALLYRRLHDDAYRRPDGVPIAALISDHSFSTHPDDEGLLRYVATVAAEAQTPVIASAAPSLVDLDWNDFVPLSEKHALPDPLGGPQHTSWRSLRELDELCYVTLALPRWRNRTPPGPWIGAASLLGGQIAVAYEQHAWPAACCEPQVASAGVEIECSIPEEVRRSLLEAGLAPAERTASGNVLVPAATSVHRPVTYQDETVTGMARQMAMLPYVAASSRIHQHLLCMARDLAGSPERLAASLTTWLSDLAADPAVARNDPRHPLVLEEGVEVTSDGFANVRLRPAYQLPPVTGTPRISLPLPLSG